LTGSLLALAESIDLDKLLAIANEAGPTLFAVPLIPVPPIPVPKIPGHTERSEASAFPAQQSQVDGSGPRIGVVRDSAFNFYYAENVELLEESGAKVVSVSALSASSLPPDLDALYIGGGFPETHAAQLSANSAFLGSLRAAAESGLPIYAECGGLMLLSQWIRWRGSSYPMAGVLPFGVEVMEQPQGHGYSELEVDAANPFFPPGTRLLGHEFHYSKIVSSGPLPPTACAVKRGVGCGGGRDGVLVHRVWASYTHLHALATPEFVKGMIAAARSRKS
jgi:cobyrinic acid a,c-diamide synthase